MSTNILCICIWSWKLNLLAWTEFHLIVDDTLHVESLDADATREAVRVDSHAYRIGKT